MKPGITNKLEQLSRRLEDLDGLLASEDVTRDMDQYRKLSKEYADITPVVERFRDYRRAERDVDEAEGMLSDPDMKDLAEQEIRDGREKIAALELDLQKLLLPRDPNDERNLFLEIRAGTGGDESALFAGDLFRMYTRYAERQRWQVELVSQSPGEVGGYKEVIARIIGQG